MNKNVFDSISKEKTLDFKVVEKDLDNLVESFINKISREFPFGQIKGAGALFLMFAFVAKNTYRSIRFICAEKPENPFRRIEYSLSSILLLRTILEEVFTLVFISEDLKNRIEWYHKAGWREMKEAYDRFLSRYGQEQKWSPWLQSYKEFLDKTQKDFGITQSDISNMKQIKYWPNHGKMKNHVKSPDLKDFLQYLDDWFYKQFSQTAHLSWPGLAKMGNYFLREDGDEKDGYIKKVRSDCVFHGITLILALFSEMEDILSFNLKEKLKYHWTIIVEYWGEAKDLYDKRYENLLV